MASSFAVARGRAEVEVITLSDSVVARLSPGDDITVRGDLGSYGSEPHSYLGLETENPDSPLGVRIVELAGDLAEELGALQGATVVVTGTVTRNAVDPGIPLAVQVTSYRVEAGP
jgi:hypothetical protein